MTRLTCTSSAPEINLLGPSGTPDLVRAEDMTRAELRRAMRVVNKHQAALLQRWKDFDG